jgi:phosphopantothenoylcysteine synthetase/decarboxylase
MAAPKSGKTRPHEPTEKTRAEVSALVSFGNTQEEIAGFIGISIDTLERRYRDELDNSIVRANAKVAAKLFRKAIDGDDIKAQIFWLKTRARWREKDDTPTVSDKIVEAIIDKLVD